MATSRLTIDANDEDVLIAAKALGDMRSNRRSVSSPTSSAHGSYSDGRSSHHATPSLISLASTSTSTSVYSESLSIDAEVEAVEVNPTGFGSRVSNLPIVRSALGAYESSKASSRVVKYGAEMVESSVKAVSRPVMDRLPLGQIDEFAGRQLDRFGGYRGSPRREAAAEDDGMQVDNSEERGRTLRESSHPWRDQSSVRISEYSSIASRATSVAPSEGYPEAGPSNLSAAHENDSQGQQVAARSKWQAMLLEAGGIGAAVSEESMKRLKYCLQWLQYATAHIDQQIMVLRDFIASLNAAIPDNPDAVISMAAMKTLQDVKKDVVDTVRQVVEVVSKYAGGALPEPARASVRDFILHLPDRWARATSATAGPQSQQQMSQTPQAQATTHPSRYYRQRPDPSNTGAPSTVACSPPQNSSMLPTAASASQAAHRILTLATESLDMMRGVTNVFKDSLDRAEAWVERLRIIGIQRGQQELSREMGSYPGPYDGPSSPEINNQLDSLTLAAYPSSPHSSSAPISPLLHPHSLGTSPQTQLLYLSNSQTGPAPAGDLGDDPEDGTLDEAGASGVHSGSTGNVRQRKRPVVGQMDIDG